MKKRITFLKKFSRIFAALLIIPALAFVTSSCSDDDEKAPDPNVISDLTGTVTLTANEATNTSTLKFTASSPWEINYTNEASEWFTFTPASGTAGNITITLTAPYNDGAAKTGSLTLKHGTNTYTIAVNQTVGQPDIAVWDADNKTALLQTLFAQDPYNATAEMPVSFTMKLTNKQDYTTLENAPFEIMTFHADASGNPTDSLISWVHVKIADNSPAAPEGKLLEMTIDTIEVNVADFKEANNRYAYICIVPKGTDKASMFDGKVMKDEYLATGTSLEQANYKISCDNIISLMGMVNVMTPPLTANSTITSNCKYTFKITDNQPTLTGWWSHSFINNMLTMSWDPEKVKTLPPMGNASASIAVLIDRGEDLQPILNKTIAPFAINVNNM